jgi:hypothetical protein
MWARRRFLAVAGGASLASVAAVGGWRYVSASDAEAIVAVLRRRLHFMRLDERGLRAFAADLAARRLVSSRRLHLLGAAGPLYVNLPMPAGRGALASELQHGEERVVSLYLLSSDFFLNGADEMRPVGYLAFYDPLGDERACVNPFARPVVSA